MALVETRDGDHESCREVLWSLRERLYTTTPVPTEAFHILSPASIGSQRLRELVGRGGLTPWFLDREASPGRSS